MNKNVEYDQKILKRWIDAKQNIGIRFNHPKCNSCQLGSGSLKLLHVSIIALLRVNEGFEKFALFSLDQPITLKKKKKVYWLYHFNACSMAVQFFTFEWTEP